MKIISWNINGIRAAAQKGFKDFLLKESPDIICLQEIKISEEARLKTEFDFAGYKEYWNSAMRPGYSGTAIFVREEFTGIKEIKNGFNLEQFDQEGRVQAAELSDFYLLNIYFPNANRELSRLDYRIKFNETLLSHIKKLEKKKPVIITGDFNVAHQEIDLARPKENEGSAGFTPEERAWFTKLLKAGFFDTYRVLQGDKIQYTWWSFRAGARERNVGWRIDYFCASVKLRKSIKKAYILDKIKGSDHATNGLEII